MCNSLKRQQWLETARDELEAHLVECGADNIPDNIRISIGFPRGKRKAIGQCWYIEASSDSHHELFISPVIADTTDLLGVVCHELIHAVCGKEAGHGPAFKRLATAAGLTGKMTATVPGDDFKLWAEHFIENHGEYPAGSLRDARAEKKQTTRLLKVECSDCGYTARVTRKWLEEAGAPLCQCNHEEMKIK